MNRLENIPDEDGEKPELTSDAGRTAQSGGEVDTSGRRRKSVHKDPEEIAQELEEGATPRASFYLMNLFATIVASYGLLGNSAPVVIGAMVIAVLLGPIGGLGYAVITADWRLLGKALFTIVTGALEVFCVAYVIGTFHSSVPFSTELLARTQPNLFDLIIALSGGAAGAYATGRNVPGGTMIGVAIATALVPPLASSAIAGAQSNWVLSGQAFLLFFTNFIAIQSAYSLVLFLLRAHKREEAKGDSKRVLKAIIPETIVLVGLAVFLWVVLERRIEDQRVESNIRTALRSAIMIYSGSSLGELTVADHDTTVNVIASIRTPLPLGPTDVREIEQHVSGVINRRCRLTVRSVLMRVANSHQFLYEPEELRIVLDQPQSIQLLDSSAAASRPPLSDTVRQGSLSDQDSLQQRDTTR